MYAINDNPVNSIIFEIYVGFGSLMAMIFCPKINLKRNSDKSRYISVLTGLGAATDEMGKVKSPLFPENDSIFYLDFELTNGDIAKVSEH